MTTGDFSGTGFYNANNSYTWTVTGNVSGSSFTFHIVYTGSNPGYTLDSTGPIASDGSLSGTTTGPGQTFTFISTSGAASPRCTATGFFRDGINMTAALINPLGTVSGDVDATGCKIGVYYSPGNTGIVDDANIHGANYYGVVVQQTSVDVINSKVHDIGEAPFNGTQHGVGIYYANVAGASNGDCTSTGFTTGTIDNNIVSSYQKGGIVVSCSNASVSVINNTVAGLGKIGFIAQNGIQISYGAVTLDLSGNTVMDNAYLTGQNMRTGNGPWISCGLLFYLTGMPKNQASFMSKNTIRDNQANLCNF